MMIDIAEQICQAVDQIVNERIKSINYDTTIIATIIENKDAKNNKYVCSNGTSSFVAYSKETTYRLNDSVLVTIPNNDYNQQKTIISKYVPKDQTTFAFTQPFDTIVDVTTNVFTGTIADSLLANEDYDQYEKEQIFEKFLTGVVFEEGQKSFTRLGLQGQFRSWLSGLSAMSGRYGYRLEILSALTGASTADNLAMQAWTSIYYKYTQNNKVDTNTISEAHKKTPETWFVKLSEKVNTTITAESFLLSFNAATVEEQKDFIYALLSSNMQISELYLDSKDMFGNPYRFQSYFEQEKVYDISALSGIYGINLYFYQISNTFFTDKGKPVRYKTDDAFQTKLMANLFTKDPYVCLGYDIRDFSSEEAILYTLDSDTFLIKDGVDPELNKKTIRLRWLHEYDNGQIRVINQNSDLKSYEVRWYRFKMGAASADEYSGVYWTKIDPIDGDLFTCIINPQVNIASEEIKAIVLYDGKVIRSNILKFTNDGDVASEATARIVAGLSIWCTDDSYGNYFIYGQNNNALESNLDNKRTDYIRELEARFADESLLAQEYNIDKSAPRLEEATEIIWEFPLNNTMLIVDGFNYSFTYDKDTEVTIGNTPDFIKMEENDKAKGINRFIKQGYLDDAKVQVRGNTIFITRYCLPDLRINPIQKYLIKKTYNATAINNTVRCSIKKNSLMYSTSKDFSFGLMGTTGTDATVVIDFENNKTALTADSSSETLNAAVHLYDSSYNELDFNNTDLIEQGLSCEWSWYAYHEFSEDQELAMLQQALNELKVQNPDAYAALTDDKIRQLRVETIAKNASIKLLGPSVGESRNICHIQHTNPIDLTEQGKSYFLILQVTIKGYGDYDLTAYKPVPIRASKQFRNIIGPTEIIYNSTGGVDYYKEPIQLWWCPDPSSINEYDMVEDQTQIIPYKLNWDIYNPYGEESSLIGAVSSNDILRPASLYTKNTDPYGIICYDPMTKDPRQPLWIQPIMIMQNNYPSATLNKWDGKSVDLSEGHIVAPAIAAGKKNSEDNTFSGVMIGDWSKTDTAEDITAQTGVYGFHHGAMSFAFKEDGTAFIGKSGFGRIMFDGNSGVLKSAAWDTKDKDGTTRNIGMFLDLDNGILKLQKEPGFDSIALTAKDYNANKYYILQITYIQVPLGTQYGASFTYTDKNGNSAIYSCDSNSTVYYKKAMTSVLRMTETIFNAKKNILYTRDPQDYAQCKAGEYSSTKEYYKYKYTKYSETVTQEAFNKNPTGYFIEHGDGYIQATVWEEKGEYYYRTFDKATGLTADEYNKNPGNYYIKKPYTYSKAGATYDRTQTYYLDGYEAQNYGVIQPPANWNTVEELGANNFYYVTTEQFVLATGEYDVLENYYVDNSGTAARYITLSSATDRYPLAIGNHSSEQGRKFKVDWDGTCYIQDGIFSGDIDAETGYLGDLILRGGLTLNYNGYIAANKDHLQDFKTNGFFLDKDGLNIGGAENYFYASTTSSLFYNSGGAVKVSGIGVDLYGSDSGEEAFTKANSEEGIMHVGWQKGTLSYPFIRFGNGTKSEESLYRTDAGVVKKYSEGIWIGTYGKNDGGQYPYDDTYDNMTGLFVHLSDGKIDRYENGKYVNIKYAVFAPDDAVVGDSATEGKPDVIIPGDDKTGTETEP